MGSISLSSSGTAFGRPDLRAAVIGAGISGVTTAAHLLREGIGVTVFERSVIAGGVWHYDARIADDPPYPSGTPSRGDYVPSRPGQFAYGTPPPDAKVESEVSPHPLETLDAAARSISFSPPGPCYAGLRNNVPTTLMVSALDAWPPGTPENTSQDAIERYIQALAADHGVNDVALYNT